jgi:hypothetical protein
VSFGAQRTQHDVQKTRFYPLEDILPGLELSTVNGLRRCSNMPLSPPTLLGLHSHCIRLSRNTNTEHSDLVVRAARWVLGDIGCITSLFFGFVRCVSDTPWGYMLQAVIKLGSHEQDSPTTTGKQFEQVGYSSVRRIFCNPKLPNCIDVRTARTTHLYLPHKMRCASNQL